MQYFQDRMLEILHKETIDTYRQRNHNAYTSLIEFKGVVERWGEMKVKTIDTVRFLGEECVDLLVSDDCLMFDSFSKDLLISEINLLIKTSDKHPNAKVNNRVLFCLNQCIDKNRQSYLKNLIKKLKSILFDDKDVPDEQMIPTLEHVDKYLSAICVQLVFEGFEKKTCFSITICIRMR